jgi:redox-sensitive bicupin YhaK (pirin superfamily)
MTDDTRQDTTVGTAVETPTGTERRLARVVTLPPPGPGFIGTGHTAVLVVDANDFARQDPFILLADDRLALPDGSPAGGEHPHAGFETVTFVLEGELHDRDEGVLRAGDVQWMTAGRGIIHSEDVVPRGRTRILQLWLTLPPDERWAEPRFETITRAAAPVRRAPGVEARVYSGRSGEARARTRNHVPVTLVDVRLDAGATLAQELPASYNGFVYVLEGSARVGGDDVALGTGQVAWLDRPAERGPSVLRIAGGDGGTRVVLYAGEPQHAPIVQHGPFVGGTRADIMRVSKDFLDGRFARMSELVRAARSEGPG